MRIKKLVSAVAAGSLVTAVAAVALAGPASAADEGPLLPGGIYWFNAVGTLDTLTAAQQISSGARVPADATNPRPFATLALENVCPAGTVNIQASVRIPQVGVPENDWTQVPITAQDGAQDSAGRWSIGAPDRLSKDDIFTYNATQAGNVGAFPFVVGCHDAANVPLGYFKTTLTVTGTTSTNYSWSIPVAPLAAAPSSTSLAASSSSIQAGDSVDLTATVTPASATGSVEFFVGSPAVSLGTATVGAGGVATLATSALPVGTDSVTAKYLGGSNAPSTSTPVTVTVAPVPLRDTTTVLTVTPTDGSAYSPITFSTAVTASLGSANGTVEIFDGAVSKGTTPCVNGVVADITLTSGVGAGAHSFTAVFTGTAPYKSSTSAPVTATYALVGAADEQTVVVTIPVGAITITTPYTPASPLDLTTAVLDPQTSTYSASAPFTGIVITDTRAGNLGFTASVVAGDFTNGAATFGGNYAGLTGLVATQVTGNALLASDVSVTDHAPFTDGLGSVKTFATYPAGATHPVGTANLAGVFGIASVPSSVIPGTYTSTVTFTAI